MKTLREFLTDNAWIATLNGMTVASACDAFRSAGVPVDSELPMRAWRIESGGGDVTLIVREKLVAVKAGRVVWNVKKMTPGLVDQRSADLLPSARRDDEARAIRVRALYRCDRKTIDEIAEIEGVEADVVRDILKHELEAAPASRKRSLRRSDVDARVNDRIDALRRMYEAQNRAFTATIENHFRRVFRDDYREAESA